MQTKERRECVGGRGGGIVMIVSACEEQLLLHELAVTLRDLFSCGSPLRWDSKCFLLLDFSTLGALGIHEIFKKLLCDHTI